MLNELISTIKIVLVLVFGFIFTRFITFCFYPNNTPQINTSNVEYLAKEIKKGPQQLIALLKNSIQPNGKTENPSGTTIVDTTNLNSFENVSKGVYAKEENGIVVTVIKQDEMDAVQYAFVVEGKPVNIRVPVNTASKEDVQKMLNEVKNYKQAN